MRDLANISTDNPKWIVLDGDIDPMWIESLNTVMDDNKVLHYQQSFNSSVVHTVAPHGETLCCTNCPQVLTLASNERVPLTPSMRLMFEISHLKAATPATVSRAGILFANPSDLGWNP